MTCEISMGSFSISGRGKEAGAPLLWMKTWMFPHTLTIYITQHRFIPGLLGLVLKHETQRDVHNFPVEELHLRFKQCLMLRENKRVHESLNIAFQLLQTINRHDKSDILNCKEHCTNFLTAIPNNCFCGLLDQSGFGCKCLAKPE